MRPESEVSAMLPSHPLTPKHERVLGARSQRGFMMIEMMLAVAIVGTAMFAVVSSFSTSARASAHVQETTTAEWLATSQIELIRTSTFVVTPGTYPAVPSPAGYTVANATSAVTGGDLNIQTVTVTVTKSGEVVYTTSAVKVNR